MAALDPFLLDIPMDLQRAELDNDVLDYLRQLPVVNNDDESSFELLSVVELLSQSKKPLFLIGGGAVNSESFSFWQNKISQLGIPHVASLKGSEKCQSLAAYYGVIGSYGNSYSQLCDSEL